MAKAKRIRYRLHCKSPIPLQPQRWNALVKAIYAESKKNGSEHVVLEAKGQNLVYEYSINVPTPLVERLIPTVRLLATIHYDGMPFDLYNLTRVS